MPTYTATARRTATQVLGTDTTGLDPDAALNAAGLLGWNVALNQATTTIVDETGVGTYDIPRQFAVIGNVAGGPRRPMGGVVTERYYPVQNEDLADWARTITDQAGGVITAAGHFAGNQVFVEMSLPGDMLINGEDPHGRSIIILNSFDKTRSLTVAYTVTRLSCTNQVAALLRNSPAVYKIRHTESATKRVAEVRAALGMGWAFDAALQAEVEKMAAEPLSTGAFIDGVRSIWPVVEEPGRARTIQINREASLIDLWNTSSTLAAIKGTRYAGYNAVTEYFDHYASAGRKGMTPEQVRATRIMTGSTARAKIAAFAQFRVPVAA